MSKWKEYKEKLGDTRPWDMLNPNIERASENANNAVVSCRQKQSC